MSVGTAVSEARARQLSRQMPDQQLVAWAVELARGMQDPRPTMKSAVRSAGQQTGSPEPVR